MAKKNKDEKTKQFVDFLVDEKNDELDLLDPSQVDESAYDFHNDEESLEIDFSTDAATEEHQIVGPRTFLVDELGIETLPLVKKKPQAQSSADRAVVEEAAADLIGREAREEATELSNPNTSVDELSDVTRRFAAESVESNSNPVATTKDEFSYHDFVAKLEAGEVETAVSVQKSTADNTTERDMITSKLSDHTTPSRSSFKSADTRSSEEDWPTQKTESPLLAIDSELVGQQKEQASSKTQTNSPRFTRQASHQSEALDNKSHNKRKFQISAMAKSKEAEAKLPIEEPPAAENGGRRTQPDAMDRQIVELQKAQNLQLAQDKILQLERELERVRLENQELAAAGHVLKRRLDELDAKRLQLEKNKQELEAQVRDEVEHSQLRIQTKNQEISELKVKVESLELRLQRDLQHVRSRERELENRLEIIRLENTAVLRSKDEHILELKRKLDQKDLEAEQLSHRLNGQVEENKDKQEKIKRTIRTLRLALNMLDEAEISTDSGKEKKTG